MNPYYDLAQRWIETSSEHDFDNLPTELQDDLTNIAQRFINWAYPDVYTIEIRPDIEELRRALTGQETP